MPLPIVRTSTHMQQARRRTREKDNKSATLIDVQEEYAFTSANVFQHMALIRVLTE